MSWIPGGEFQMGSVRFYPEERPVHRVAVAGFWMDTHPVTVEQFRRFAKATGYVTVAERQPERADYPDADPDLLVPGSLVFRRTRGPVDLRDYRNWWAYVPGACWRHPEGPGSDCRRRERHPVTHVAYEDAEAMRHGPARSCPPKPNGNSPHAAASTAPSLPGATSSRPTASIWPIPGRVNFRARIFARTASSALRRSRRSRRTATACTT
jgi:hypothetical protein